LTNQTKQNHGQQGNVVHVDFRARCRQQQVMGSTEMYEEYVSPATTNSAPAVRPPQRETTSLSLRRDEVMGERLGEIAGIDCGSNTVNVALALNGQAPDERWLKQLVITIHDEVTGFKIGAPVANVTPSESGGFIHLKSLPFKGATPTPNDVSWGTVVRISGPRGWSLQATIAEMNWFNVMP
jgi:hypothetical protein